MTRIETKNNYIISIVYDAGRYGISIADVSTEVIFTTQKQTASKLFDEIYKFSPSRINPRLSATRRFM